MFNYMKHVGTTKTEIAPISIAKYLISFTAIGSGRSDGEYFWDVEDLRTPLKKPAVFDSLTLGIRDRSYSD
ncbi:hypothetical protein L596_023765 [Steinernema carpocapsae]|uniref:Uncharacterized protein n=1 Tax=Steinernema carpocapsae TaxID=34508 RepID=A0A4V5ZZI7_STECR|nr:hypothetical protein L596_023765 [Steinernema carpocapsae]